MNENPTATNWSAERGEKWLAGLAQMEAMLTPVNEPLIRALNLEGPLRIADVGCGGGGATLEVLGRAPAGSVVHGYDLSPALVDLARTRKPGDEAISFEIADMATAIAPAQRYHRLVSRFGIMFFNDPAVAFTNLFRWLVPGGRIAFAVWGSPADNPWIGTVREVVAAIVDLPPKDPEGPGPFRYADAARLTRLLNKSGFVDLAVNDWRGMLPIGGGLAPAEAANFALASFSSFSERLSESGDDALNQARQTLTARFSRHQQDGAVHMDASVHIVTGGRGINSSGS